jgi:hypothetical protein
MGNAHPACLTNTPTAASHSTATCGGGAVEEPPTGGVATSPRGGTTGTARRRTPARLLAHGARRRAGTPPCRSSCTPRRASGGGRATRGSRPQLVWRRRWRWCHSWGGGGGRGPCHRSNSVSSDTAMVLEQFVAGRRDVTQSLRRRLPRRRPSSPSLTAVSCAPRAAPTLYAQDPPPSVVCELATATHAHSASIHQPNPSQFLKQIQITATRSSQTTVSTASSPPRHRSWLIRPGIEESPIAARCLP